MHVKVLRRFPANICLKADGPLLFGCQPAGDLGMKVFKACVI